MKGANALKLKTLINAHCHQTAQLSHYYEPSDPSESFSSNAFTSASSEANDLYVKYKPIFHLRNQSLAATKQTCKSADASDAPLDYEETLLKLLEASFVVQLNQSQQENKSLNGDIESKEAEPSIELSDELIKAQNQGIWEPQNIQNLMRGQSTVLKTSKPAKIWK